MAISLAGGILTAAQLPLYSQVVVTVLAVVAAGVLAFFFVSPPRLSGYVLILLLFLAGALRIQGASPSSPLTPLASQDKKAAIEGVVLDPVKIIDNRMGRFTLRAQCLCLPEKDITIDENLAVTVYRNMPDLHPGDRLRFSARLRLFRNFNNPGNYNYQLAMEIKGLTCAASVSDGARMERLGPGRLPFFRGLVEKLQRPVRDFFRERLIPFRDALFRALILGERQGITPALREPFNRTGLGHILAVSGLHIGLVAGFAYFLLRWTFYRSYRLALTLDVRKLAALLTCLPVIGYALLAGFQLSTQRAMIMVLAYLASIVLGRERDVWSTLSLAGLIILLLDPKALFSISFQLSFLAVIGILWLTPAILRWFCPTPDPLDEKRPSRHRILDYFIGLAAVSASAAFFLLPVTAAYFHRIPLVSIPANVTTLPILGMWVIPAGLLSSAALPFSTDLAAFFLQIGEWGLAVMMWIIQFWAGLSWSSIWTVTPNLFEILIFYFLIVSIFFFRRFRWARIGLAAAIVLTLGDVAYWVYEVRFNPDLRVTFLDVGKGNAALVSFPGGKKMLIDGGGFTSDTFDVGEMVVAPYLWHSKIMRVDYLVLSHPQADHMNGLRFIARHFHPEELWVNGDRVETPSYRELMQIIDDRDIRKILPSDLKGSMEINGVRIQLLHPDPDRPISGIKDEGKRLNNHSLVLKISYANTSFLFPGDIETPGEKAVVARFGEVVQSDVLLSPHHGSKTSSSKEFLEAVKPLLCIISSGEREPRNFPHPTVLKRLEEIGCDVLPIARVGAVTIAVRPDQFDVQTFLNGRPLLKNIFPHGNRDGIFRPKMSDLPREWSSTN